MAKFKLNEVNPNKKIEMLKYIKALTKDLKTIGILKNSKIRCVRTAYSYKCSKKRYKSRNWAVKNYIFDIITNTTCYTIVPERYDRSRNCYIMKWYKNEWVDVKEINLHTRVLSMKKTRKIELTVL